MKDWKCLDGPTCEVCARGEYCTKGLWYEGNQRLHEERMRGEVMSDECHVKECKYCAEVERMGAITSKARQMGTTWLTYEMLEKSFNECVAGEYLPKAAVINGELIVREDETEKFPFGFTDARDELKKTEPSPSCRVCWDAKAAADQAELVGLRREVELLRIQNGGLRKVALGEREEWRKWQAVYRQTLNSPDPAVDRGVPDPNYGQQVSPAPNLLDSQGWYNRTDVKDLGGAIKGPTDIRMDDEGTGPSATRRTCTRTLPGHPVELNEDETKCWKCGNGEFS